MDFAGWDPIIRKAILKTLAAWVSETSREIYINKWEAYQKWRSDATPPFTGPTGSKQIHGYLATRWADGSWKASSTLWSKLSILRMMAQIVEKSCIKDDPDDLNTQAWLKSLGKGQKPKQAATFSRSEVLRYLHMAAGDVLSLSARLFLLIGCNIGCRSQTLYQLEHRHIQETEADEIRITIKYMQKHDQGAKGKSWVIRKNADDSRICTTALYRQYHAIAVKAKIQQGWLWRKLYMVRSEVKIKNARLDENWVIGLPRMVSEHLGLDGTAKYTGHALRRTCAIWHVDSGATDQEMRIHFGWKNTSMASRYKSNSDAARINASERTAIKNKGVQVKSSLQKEELHAFEDEKSVSCGKMAMIRPPIPTYMIVDQMISISKQAPVNLPKSVYNFGGAQIGSINIYNQHTESVNQECKDLK